MVREDEDLDFVVRFVVSDVFLDGSYEDFRFIGLYRNYFVYCLMKYWLL